MTADRFAVQLKDKIRLVPNCQYRSGRQFIITANSSACNNNVGKKKNSLVALHNNNMYL